MKINNFLFFAMLVLPLSVWADCTTPTALTGALKYITAAGKVKFCNGSQWVDTSLGTGGAGSCVPGTVDYETTANILRYCDSSNAWISMKGETPATCSSGLEGKFGFDTTTKSLRFCDGVNWYNTHGPVWIQKVQNASYANTGHTIVLPSATYQAGDVLVSFQGCETDGGLSFSSPTGGTGLSWTLLRSALTVDYAVAAIYTATVGSTQTSVITLNMTNSWGLKCAGGLHAFRYSSGVGNHAVKQSSGAPTMTFAVSSDNSAVFVLNTDWNAVDGSSRTWRTNFSPIAGETYGYETGAYTFYAAVHRVAGAARSAAIGLSAPAGQKYTIFGVEIKAAQ